MVAPLLHQVAVFDNPVEDGYLDFNQQTYVRHATEYNIIFGRFMSGEARGYVEWDISSLPSSLIVTGVVFEYSGNQVYEYDANIMESTVQPTLSSNDLIFNSIPNGKRYVGPTGIPYAAGGPYEVDLGDLAKSDLQSKVQNGITWFAVGFYITLIDSEYWNAIWSEESVGKDFPPYPPTISPTIRVEYFTEPPPVPEFPNGSEIVMYIGVGFLLAYIFHKRHQIV
jgi:hypothetical protein